MNYDYKHQRQPLRAKDLWQESKMHKKGKRLAKERTKRRGRDLQKGFYRLIDILAEYYSGSITQINTCARCSHREEVCQRAW